MNLKMKKLFIIVICISMLLTAAACAKNAPDGLEDITPNAPENIDIESAALNDAEAWVDENDGDAKFYLGMSAAELLKRLQQEGIEIQTGRDFSKYTDQGVGAHEVGMVFVDAEPFSFLLDKQDNVKAIRVYPIITEIYPSVAGVVEGMLIDDIEDIFGEPTAKHIQGESVTYYYDQGGYFLEFSFDKGFDKPNESGELELFRYAVFNDKNDGYWTEW